MEYRLKKQVIIAGVFFLLLVSFFSSGYFLFFQRNPTCFDKVQNQGEESVDCGGPCVSCEELNLKNPEIKWAKIFKVESGLYDVGALVSNVNINYGSGTVPYVFTVYGLNGKVLAEKRGNGFILPREEKYILEPGLRIAEIPRSVVLEFGKTKWQKFDNFEANNFTVYGVSYGIIPLEKRGIGFFEVYGNFVNKTPFDFEKVAVNSVLYDAPLDRRGMPVAINKRIENTVRSGEDRAFKMIWPAVPTGRVLGADIRVETNVFLSDNFLQVSR